MSRFGSPLLCNRDNHHDMPDQGFDPALLNGFQLAAQSLKLYRRADLVDETDGTSLIDELYVDPLPRSQVLVTLQRPNTTFVIGRKGTGKSTVFQRLQSEIRRTRHQTSAYVDIKTVFESSQIDPALLERLSVIEHALPAETLERLLLYRSFLRAVVLEIKAQLRQRVESSVWEQVKERVTGSISALFEGLDNLLEDSNDDRFIEALGAHERLRRTSQRNAVTVDTSRSVSGSLSVAPSVDVGATDATNATNEAGTETAYTSVLIPALGIKDLIIRLRDILNQLGIRHLLVLVDDFSELPEEAMRVVVDVLLAPLNNWSEEFIKFKIAAYPGRVYYGAIDKTKIDEVYLDTYRLYGGTDISRMEDSGTAFIKRLVESRVQHFCRIDPAEFLDADAEEVWRQLFFATAGNPRILGFLLQFVYESRLIEGRRVGVSAVQDAARRFFEEKVEPYFTLGKFLHETFNERASIFSLKELLETIIVRARELRTHESEVIRRIKGRPPTSHFHVPIEYESLFSTLELNFFLTKYFEMSDRSGRKVAVFALNYGLCQKFALRFGRPTGEREFRLYFVERIFDYSTLVKSYLERNQEIVCPKCGYRYALEHLEALRFFGMLCKECKQATVTVTNLAKKYGAELQAVNAKLLLPALELGILQTLNAQHEAVRPAVVAEEMDVSYQLVGRRAKGLSERGLVKRLEDPQGRRLLKIEASASAAYFSEEQREQLNVPADEEDTPAAG